MSKKSKHVRACPVCGVVVEWTRHPRVKTTMPNGEVIDAIPLSLECPEHGPFDNIAGRLNSALTRVMKEIEK